MTPEASENTQEVASWRREEALRQLEDADDRRGKFYLSAAVDTHIKAEPQVAQDPGFLEFLGLAHNFFLAHEDYKEAHHYGVRLYQLERPDLGAPLVHDSGYLLGMEELAKAEAALNEQDFRRAADKGVWAAVHISDAIRAGRIDAHDEFYTAAGVAFEGNAHYQGDADAIERPIFALCDEHGIPRPTEMLTAIRLKAFEEAFRSHDGPRSLLMLWHAEALEEVGIRILALTRLAGVMGVRAYLQGSDDLYPDRFFETLERAGAFSAGTLKELRLAARKREYETDLRRATEPSPFDSPIWGWFTVARTCIELVKLGDEAAKENLHTALQQQTETIDRGYFRRDDMTGIEIHFDRYVEAGFISQEDGDRLKKALKGKLEAIREQCAQELTGDDEEDWSVTDALKRIDETIAEYTQSS